MVAAGKPLPPRRHELKLVKTQGNVINKHIQENGGIWHYNIQKFILRLVGIIF